MVRRDFLKIHTQDFICFRNYTSISNSPQRSSAIATTIFVTLAAQHGTRRS